MPCSIRGCSRTYTRPSSSSGARQKVPEDVRLHVRRERVEDAAVDAVSREHQVVTAVQWRVAARPGDEGGPAGAPADARDEHADAAHLVRRDAEPGVNCVCDRPEALEGRDDARAAGGARVAPPVAEALGGHAVAVRQEPFWARIGLIEAGPTVEATEIWLAEQQARWTKDG